MLAYQVHGRVDAQRVLSPRDSPDGGVPVGGLAVVAARPDGGFTIIG
jgi:hypothetical protein